MSCFKCGGPQHEATGWHFAEGVDYCGRCASYFFHYYRSRMIRMSSVRAGKGHDYALAASTSVGANVREVAQ